jgi:peptidoglycan/xylan/chitin deacetylase (PgdA/CDA1 family)
MWPEGVRCCAVLSFDLDAELFWSVWLDRKPTLLDRSQGEYGPKVGLPRILAMLARHDLPATFFVPGWVAEKYPDAVGRITDAGHEIAHHGYHHENFATLSAAAQREVLSAGARALEAATGRTPRGSRLIPGEDTAAILREAGYLYSSIMMDAEMPYRHMIDGQPSDLIELPVTFAFNDSSVFAYTFGLAKPLLTPRVVEAMYLDEFEALYAEGGFCMFMFHPQLIGRPGRLRMLERVVTYMNARSDVLFTTAEKVADRCRQVLPREEGEG